MAIQEKLTQAGPKRLLTLDGGGIRGIVTVEVLARIEAMLQKRLGRGSDFVLSDYFDYVAGTSTGAIIATCVSLGWRVDKIRSFYVDSGREMFDKASLLRRLRYKYDDEPLANMLKQQIGEETTLGSDDLKTLLMVVLRNATTDSPWPLSNNPYAKYNDRSRPDCNLDLPLWQIVRASTAAPTYFPPEIVRLGKEPDTYDFIFVDGGVTPYNNPAFLLFLMATVKAYRLEWEAGEDRMLLVSVGTGMTPEADAGLRDSQMHLLHSAATIPGALMFGASSQQDILCRAFGRCRSGGLIDWEIEALTGEGSIILGAESQGLPKHFAYMRYNAELTREGLEELGLKSFDPHDVQVMDSVDHIGDLQTIGRAIGEQQVGEEDFAPFLTQPAAVGSGVRAGG